MRNHDYVLRARPVTSPLARPAATDHFTSLRRAQRLAACTVRAKAEMSAPKKATPTHMPRI
jgi:hypothetical protein